MIMEEEKKYNEIDEMLASLLSGEVDKCSFDKFKKKYFESESNRRYIDNKIEIWFSAKVCLDTIKFDKEKALSKFKDRIFENINKKKKRKQLIFRQFMRIAVCIIVLLLPFSGYWFGKKNAFKSFTDIVVEVPAGAKTKMFLPDSTLVWLNSGSRLEYSQGFGFLNRNLKLEGEGYFEVSKNEKMPFTINTSDLNLKVIGTKFNFKNYPNDKEISVNLFEGKVALNSLNFRRAELYLYPNEKAVMNKYTGEIKKMNANVENSNAWIRNELIFNDESLINIAKELERNFNVKIDVVDRIKNECFSARFDVFENNIDDILQEMTLTNRLHYKKEDKRFLLY